MSPLVFLAAVLGALTPAFAAEQVSPASAYDYELRGFFGVGENTEISLRRTVTDKSAWYHLGEKTSGVLVEKADSKTGTATIVVNGVHRTLHLAGETAPETTEEKHLRYAKALNDYYSQWDSDGRERMSKVIGESFRTGMGELLKSHPEYLNNGGFDTPEAKAEIMNLMKQAVLAATSNTPTKDGVIPRRPENFEAMLDTMDGNFSVSMGGPVEKDATSKDK